MRSERAAGERERRRRLAGARDERRGGGAPVGLAARSTETRVRERGRGGEMTGAGREIAEGARGGGETAGAATVKKKPRERRKKTRPSLYPSSVSSSVTPS